MLLQEPELPVIGFSTGQGADEGDDEPLDSVYITSYGELLLSFSGPICEEIQLINKVIKKLVQATPREVPRG
jgi:hypothetical protein